MLVFREIEELVREVKSRLASLGVESDSKLDGQRFLLLQQVVTYVNSMVWLSHGKTREKVKSFLRSRYNYQEVAERYGVSVSQMHKCISYAGSQLRRRIGGTLLLIKSGALASAEREFALATGAGDPSALFVKGMHDWFDTVKDAGVDISTCDRELSFLSCFTNRNIDRVIDSLDPRKVSHLLYILLKGDITYVSERGILSRCIVDGELDALEAIALLKEDFIYARSSIS
ncbi:hypothetical protein [Ammoniphilus sp. CFH 90114]|uniref:hypothetical protein n=1 Tax=Ammoniphilus sp. CFH 90114 TaxID=2493665 RepID=UPI00100FB82C|nr:hypothetical protein [Ammoniphilus sp. CFH 90114]RXT08833.1 hypothetical protein EIZ39_08515 [Ammoniphilus sp. CFH 90114]